MKGSADGVAVCTLTSPGACVALEENILASQKDTLVCSGLTGHQVGNILLNVKGEILCTVLKTLL